MKQVHFPDLTLCKKLTELGFPHTRSIIFELPGRIEEYRLLLDENGCRYDDGDGFLLSSVDGTPPNALARMYIWLKENNYISSIIE